MRGDLHARAGHQKPAGGESHLSRERAHGPQLKVKPAASTHLQPGGRAAHFTAKATPSVGVPRTMIGSGGVRGAARVQGEVRNTRGPSAQPESGQGSSYKPTAKSSAVQRESEGIAVPQSAVARTNTVTNNAVGGKGPCGDRAGGAPCVDTARDAICSLAKHGAGRASTSSGSVFIVCAARSPIRRNPSGRGLHNAADRPITGKPCAGNRHARLRVQECGHVQQG